MTTWTQSNIVAERMSRQGLTKPLNDWKNEEAYIALFRNLQPVAPVHFTRPGDPPKLVHRTRYDDRSMASVLREKHRIIKGRFQGSRVAYVLEEDLKLYATAFRKVPSRFSEIHEEVMRAVKESGGLSKDQLKEQLSYPSGEISKALQDLQAAFLLYEEQTDTDWDTGWLDFAEEWFQVPVDAESQMEALTEVLYRFIEPMVFATERQIKNWSGIPTKTIKNMIDRLVDGGRLLRIEVDGLGNGLMTSKDALSPKSELSIPRCTFMLDKSDYLVRADMAELKAKYKGLEVLQYLFIDGAFQGAVLGHWGFGPYNIDDIVLDLDEKESLDRQEEIVEAVRAFYSSEHHTILRYNGRVL